MELVFYFNVRKYLMVVRFQYHLPGHWAFVTLYKSLSHKIIHNFRRFSTLVCV